MIPPKLSARSLHGAGLLLGLLGAMALHAQDAPPVDANALRQSLSALRDQQATQLKAQKTAAIQPVMAGAASGERAASLWEEAVRATQFDGAAKEGTQFHEWKDKEGDALHSKEGQNAARLFFHWLGLTLQRSSGTTVKDLLPAIVAFTKEVTNDQLAMDAFEDNMKREKEQDSRRKPTNNSNARKSDEAQVKKMHDAILAKPLAGSPVVQWMKLQDFVAVPNWEQSPANVDGIFQKIVLPELRLGKDPRVLEYWDMRMKREAEAATKNRLSFEVDKYNSVRRPTLLWHRAEELIGLGQKNKAITDMFALIKANPAHPEAAGWIAQLEQLLLPPPPPGTIPASNGSTPAAVPPSIVE